MAQAAHATRRRRAEGRADARRQRALLALIAGALALYLAVGALAPLAHAVVSALRTHAWLLWLASLALLLCGCAGVTLWRLAAAASRHERARRLARLGALERLRALSPTEFELVIGELLRQEGYRDVRHTGGGGDLAADLICRDARGALVVVQCKRYGAGKRVTSPQLQLFIGMVYTHHQADYGVVVTTSTFTRPAIALARQHGIALLDGATLTERLLAFRAER